MRIPLLLSIISLMATQITLGSDSRGCPSKQSWFSNKLSKLLGVKSEATSGIDLSGIAADKIVLIEASDIKPQLTNFIAKNDTRTNFQIMGKINSIESDGTVVIEMPDSRHYKYSDMYLVRVPKEQLISAKVVGTQGSIGRNLQNIDLTNTDISALNLSGVDLRNAKLGKSFAATFEPNDHSTTLPVHFEYSDLRGADLKDAGRHGNKDILDIFDQNNLELKGAIYDEDTKFPKWVTAKYLEDQGAIFRSNKTETVSWLAKKQGDATLRVLPADTKLTPALVAEAPYRGAIVPQWPSELAKHQQELITIGTKDGKFLYTGELTDFDSEKQILKLRLASDQRILELDATKVDLTKVRLGKVPKQYWNSDVENKAIALQLHKHPDRPSVSYALYIVKGFTADGKLEVTPLFRSAKHEVATLEAKVIDTFKIIPKTSDGLIDLKNQNLIPLRNSGDFWHLSNTDLRNKNITREVFENKKFPYRPNHVFSNADLRGADISGAELKDTLDGAIFDEKTIIPSWLTPAEITKRKMIYRPSGQNK